MKKLLLVIVGILFAFNANATTIPEGAVVKTASNPDVYIVKYKNGKQFKRLVLNPQVFESYGHLRWEDILIITQSEMNSFKESSLVRSDGENSVFTLIANGDTGDKAIVDSNYTYDPDAVYTINSTDSGNYFLKQIGELASKLRDIKLKVATQKIDLCNNIEGEQTYVPAGMYRDNGNCFTDSKANEGSVVFSEWSKRAVKVTCSWKGLAHLEGGEVVYGSGEYFDVSLQGSGTMFFKKDGQIPFVISNSHIVVHGNQCVVSVPNSYGGFYNYDSFAVIPDSDLDVSMLFLSDQSIGNMKFGPIGNSPSASTLTFAKNYSYCTSADIQIGDKVYILGYPSIGGSTLTITDGIISGYNNNFYKTSAKIDHGNSGGVAILGKNNCYLGIPTSATVGEIESLGQILDLTYMERYLK